MTITITQEQLLVHLVPNFMWKSGEKTVSEEEISAAVSAFTMSGRAYRDQ
jgi:hypothetical protein